MASNTAVIERKYLHRFQVHAIHSCRCIFFCKDFDARNRESQQGALILNTFIYSLFEYRKGHAIEGSPRLTRMEEKNMRLSALTLSLQMNIEFEILPARVLAR
jgi:hypothetical protein